MKKTTMSFVVLLLAQVLMVGMSAYWSRFLPFENWNYLGAWMYFGPMFFLQDWPQSFGDRSASSKPWFGFVIYVITTFVTLVARDGFIGEWFYPGWEWVYLGFFSYALVAMGVLAGLPRFLKECKQDKNTALGGDRGLLVGVKSLGVLLGSISFFLISNFGVWLQGGLYTRDWRGLIECYWLALPFLKTTLSSDVVFGFLFIVSSEFALREMRKRKPATLFVADQD